jgi:4-amino-4-deoxy-L-arabinose transferase-like glycosyltransferase
MLAFTVLVLGHQITRPGIYTWDESRQAVNAIEMLINGDVLITHFNGSPDLWNTKPPLLIWLMTLSMSLFGPNVVAIRLPSALAALGTVLVLADFCLRYLRDWRKACLSGFIITTSVGFIGYHVASTADYDALLVFWETLYCFLFFKYLEDEQKHWKLYLSAICLCGALLTKGIAGSLCLPGLAIYALWKRKFIRLIKNYRLYGVLLLVVAVVGGYYLLREQASTGFLQAVFTNEVSGRYLQAAEDHDGPITYYYSLLIESQFVPWVYALPLCLLIGLFNRNVRIREVMIFCTVCSFVFLMLISTAHTKISWYSAPVIPFLSLIVASGLVDTRDWLAERLFKNHAKLMLELILIAIACIGVTVHIFHINRKDRWVRSSEDPYALILKDMKQIIPHKKKYLVLKDDRYADYDSPTYRPQVLFYLKSEQLQGYTLEISSMKRIWHVGDTLVSCNADILKAISKSYRVQKIHSARWCDLYIIN